MCRWIVGLCVSAVLILGSAARADDEEKVPLDKLPKPVVAAVKKKFPKARLVSASKEVENKKTLFEVQIKDGAQTVEVTVTPEGKIVEIEKEITAKALPAAVTKALNAKYPKATFKKVEEITEGGKLFYEVLLVTAGKQTIEVKMDSTGKVIEEEKKKGGDKDDKDEKKK
jgi:uncharacterized membrane protein YkoI